jgi:DNA-3-methyladenine glycosylase II
VTRDAAYSFVLGGKNALYGSSVENAIRNAERRLAKIDAVMKRLIARHGHCPLAEREFQPFHMLANSIISQQLSSKAAATIKKRVGEIVGVPFHTEKVLSVSTETLRRAGLSQAKTRYIRELVAQVGDGRLAFEEMISLDDESVIEKLVEVPGIGGGPQKCFCSLLKRLDVLAVGDAGLQRQRSAVREKRKSKTLLPRVAEAWRRIDRSLRGICGDRWKMFKLLIYY